NASAIVGELYSPEDKRRDAGFSLFYIGINIGALTAPMVCSFLGEKIYWHLGFGAAGLGMTLGLIQYHLGRERLAHVGAPPSQTSAETRRKAAIGVLFMAAISAAVGVLFFGPEIVEALGVRWWLGGSAADKLLSGAKFVVKYKPWIML